MLKLDPKNTELLNQKQTVLNQTIQATEEKLNHLKEIKAKADEQMANGTAINEENYRNLQREIIKTQRELSDLKNESSNWVKTGDKLIEWGKHLDSIGKKIDSLGNKLTTRLTVPITGAMTVATKKAIEFESAFTGVTKTVDGTEEQLESLKKGIKELSKEIPSSTTEIAAIAEAAGQLGIQTDNVLDFTKTMINMGNATNLSADEAATTLARFANVTRMSQSDFDKLGSVIVDLGNNFATTEAEITQMGMNLASAGTQVGMSQSDIMGLATALSSVGLEAQAGGTAFSKVMVNMQLAVEKGGKDLKNFASVAGMTTKDFKKAFKEDATGAIMKFVEGLSKSGERGKSAIKILDSMGIKETRLRDALLRSANASEIMEKAVKLGNKAWDENKALVNEANKRYQTTESQLQKARNKIDVLGVSLGEKLLPSINNILDKADKWIEKLDSLSDSQKENIIQIGLMVAAAGPLLKVAGSTISIVGDVTKGVGTFTKAIGLAYNGIGSATGSAATLAKVFQALVSPAGLAAAGIALAVGIIVANIKSANKETTEAFNNMGNATKDFYEGIDTAKSHLDAFNEELFVSAEEQQDLKNQMNEVQQGITNICKTASDERRGYTQEEITQLDEYFTKLRELNQREIEIQQQISTAITQQAETNAKAFQGSLDEYKVQSQEWIKTAEEQKEKTIELIKKQTIEEVALLNSRYSTEEDRQTEEYKKEYDRIVKQKDEKIKEVTDEVAKVNSAYSNGYLERVKQNDGFFAKVQEYNEKIEKENKRSADNLEWIQNNQLLTQSNKNGAKEDENYRHQKETQKIWNQMYKDMDDSQEKQLGTWLAMVSQTELYGGEIDEETQRLVDSILESYDSMPKGTREAMKNAMTPMLDEMKNKEPSLFSKATSIANGILSRLKKAFDIHSPSKKTRAIFKNVMLGAEVGLKDEEKNLNKQIDAISKNALDSFYIRSKIGFNNELKRTIIDSTRTVFTTPQIVFNVQELDKGKLQQCFDYINQKFGSRY